MFNFRLDCIFSTTAQTQTFSTPWIHGQTVHMTVPLHY